LCAPTTDPAVTEPIFHLALAADWDAAVQHGAYRISTRGLSLDQVGFIHAARAEQVQGVAERFYADVTEPMVLLAIDRYELVRRGIAVIDEPAVADNPNSERFPHIYGELPIDAVTSSERYAPGQ